MLAETSGMTFRHVDTKGPDLSFSRPGPPFRLKTMCTSLILVNTFSYVPFQKCRKPSSHSISSHGKLMVAVWYSCGQDFKQDVSRGICPACCQVQEQ